MMTVIVFVYEGAGAFHVNIILTEYFVLRNFTLQGITVKALLCSGQKTRGHCSYCRVVLWSLPILNSVLFSPSFAKIMNTAPQNTHAACLLLAYSL